MNETFKRRLIGLIVVIALLFGLSWLLPRDGKGGSGDVPATVVPLPITETAPPSGEQVAATDPAASATSSGAGNESPTTSPTGGGSEAASPPDEVQPAAPAAVKPPPKPPVPAARKADKPAPPKPATPASAPATTKPPPPPAKPTAAPAASLPPTDARTWYVQIGSFADQRNAQTTLSLLNGIGYSGESVAFAGANGGSLYRVRLGPFPNEAAARQAQDKVMHQGYPQSRALSEPAHAP